MERNFSGADERATSLSHTLSITASKDFKIFYKNNSLSHILRYVQLALTQDYEQVGVKGKYSLELVRLLIDAKLLYLLASQ